MTKTEKLCIVKDFSQLSLIEGSDIPKTKTKYTKTFKNTLLNTDNTFKTVQNPDLLSFLNETLPSDDINLTERQIETRLKLYQFCK